MKRIVDEHNLEVLGRFGAVGRCRVQVFQDVSRPLVLLTQHTGGHDGQSLANAAERFADAVRDRYLPGSLERPDFVAWYVRPDEIESWDAPGAGPLMTVFDNDGCPHWRKVAPPTKQLLRLYADPGRGDAYVPTLVSPSSVGRWAVYPTSNLPPPQPFRASCMNPLGGGLVDSLCGCWYHTGDWHQAASAAITALTQARSEVSDAEDAHEIGRLAAERLTSTVQDSWIQEAASSLLLDPVELMSDLDDYVNGQHRCRAMLDQHVRRVPLIVELEVGHASPALMFE